MSSAAASVSEAGPLAKTLALPSTPAATSHVLDQQRVERRAIACGRAGERRSDVARHGSPPLGRILDGVPPQGERGGRLSRRRDVEPDAPAAPAFGSGDCIGHAERLQQAADVELSESLGCTQPPVPDPSGEPDRECTLALEELVDVQKLFRRLREQAQCTCKCARPPR